MHKRCLIVKKIDAEIRKGKQSIVHLLKLASSLIGLFFLGFPPHSHTFLNALTCELIMSTF